jgi:hypothetical protein
LVRSVNLSSTRLNLSMDFEKPLQIFFSLG